MRLITGFLRNSQDFSQLGRLVSKENDRIMLENYDHIVYAASSATSHIMNFYGNFLVVILVSVNLYLQPRVAL